ncbi:biotin/lipoyl-binding protein [Solwaraspora sp. WMMA2065]|uniref:efflux RND transporter periplasmic adaptor subunit n=1 Tax=Solwaraspora sp. WMMA2065 TaxID=3015166 RepID=UPI00259B7F7B|nr:biotin/lipoyl-binding protein [Solwaraspora sp. WMMA2065]WJK33508.1 HlyD family efflux transporter periplasmic adaptor subunit [Solwaraspora sp. WMMA2065]
MPVRRLAGLRRPLILNAVLVLAVLGLLGWTYHTVVGPDNTAVAAGSAATATVVVEQATVTATVTASGSVRSAKTAVADFVTGGTVTEILVSVGQQVDEGAVLARVDDTVAQRELDAARANLDAAQDALDTAEVAGVSTADAVAAVTEAELAVDEAQAAVDGTTLTAPVAGTVVAVNGSVGASTGGGTGSSSAGGGTGSSSSSGASGFVDLADLTQLEVTASVSETDATRLETGQPATVRWNALPDTEATASIGVIDPNAATTNGVVSYPITLDLDSLPEGVRPGQTVEVTVVVGEAVDVLTVSPAALTGTGTRQSVTVLVDGAQVSRTVEVGLQGDDAVEIISGLAVGEQVVVVIPTESESGSGGFPGGGGLTGGGGFPGGGGPGAGGFSGGGRPGGGR